MSEKRKTCGTCSHWRRQPADPNNLGAMPPGLCCEGPPAFMLVPTPQGMAPGFGYPTLPGNYEACHRHAPANVLVERELRLKGSNGDA